MLTQIYTEAIGWGGQIIDSFMRHVNGDDIVGMGIRLALIGVMGSLVRTLFSYTWLDEGRSHSPCALCQCLSFIDTRLALFPTAFVQMSDPAFDWIHTFLAQDPSVIKQMKSYRVVTSNERESQGDDVKRQNKKAKKNGLALTRKDADWTSDSVVAQLLPIDGELGLLRQLSMTLPWAETRRSEFETRLQR